MASLTPVFLAGINNSEPEHWQSSFRQRLPAGLWVEHGDWDAPIAAQWVAELDQALAPISGPVVFVAHSLGCLLVTEWVLKHPEARAAGAFCVAPPDPASPAFPHHVVQGFRPATAVDLPFPAMLVASQDDPYGSFEYASRVARAWRAPLIDAGAKGHLNAASGLGDWPEGWGFFHAFLKQIGQA